MAKRKTVRAAVDDDSLPPPLEPVSEELRPLNAKQWAFIHEYIANGENSTQAYLFAYGSSYATANTNGCYLLRDTRIQEKIEAERAKLRESRNFTREKYIDILTGMAFGSKADLQLIDGDEDGDKPLHSIGNRRYGLDCKASDRKAALDELKVMFALGSTDNKRDVETHDTSILDALQSLMQTRK